MPPVNITEPTLLIRIPKLFRADISPDELYEATRGVWRIGERRNDIRLALAVADGVVQEAFSIDQWHPAGTTPYKTRHLKDVAILGRWEFTGTIAPEGLRAKYVAKSVAHYFQRGDSNPIRYLNAS